MKQLLLILVLLVGLYSGWQVLKPEDRTKVKDFTKRHGVRLKRQLGIRATGEQHAMA